MTFEHAHQIKRTNAENLCPRPELDHKAMAMGSRGSCTKVCPEPDLNPYYMLELRDDLLLP
jgi:hypothetical protein